MQNVGCDSTLAESPVQVARLTSRQRDYGVVSNLSSNSRFLFFVLALFIL